MIGALALLEPDAGTTGAELGDWLELSEGVGPTVDVLPPLPSAPGFKVAVVRGSGMELVSTSSMVEAEVKPKEEVAIT